MSNEIGENIKALYKFHLAQFGIELDPEDYDTPHEWDNVKGSELQADGLIEIEK